MTGLTNQAIPSGTVTISDPLQVYNQPLSADQLVNLDFNHYMVHIGRFYAFSHYVASIASSATYYMAFETGADLVHMNAEYRVSQDFRWETRTGFAYNADGTVITPLNERFDVRGNPAYTCLGRARYGMTVTNTGSVAQTRYIPSGGRGIGSHIQNFGVEWVLAANTQYLFSYYNLSNQTGIFNLLVTFYELNLPV